MAEPGADTNVDNGRDGVEQVSVDVPASAGDITDGGHTLCGCSSEGSIEEPAAAEEPVRDVDGLRTWVGSINPPEFDSAATESFFVKWEALGLPQVDSDTLYEFSGTPEETHAVALRAIDRWTAPEPKSEEPRLWSF